jgi:hypothetical protein
MPKRKRPFKQFTLQAIDFRITNVKACLDTLKGKKRYQHIIDDMLSRLCELQSLKDYIVREVNR